MPSASQLRGQPHLPGARPARPGPAVQGEAATPVGRLHLGLGLAAAQARAGEACGCIPVWGWNGSWLQGGGSGGQDWPHPQDRVRKSAVSLQGGVSPGDRRCGAYASGADFRAGGTPASPSASSGRRMGSEERRGGTGHPRRAASFAVLKWLKRVSPGIPFPVAAAANPVAPSTASAGGSPGWLREQ